MTVASTVSRVDYTGNGTADTFDYTFRVFDEDDLLVTVRDSDNLETTLVKTTHYTVTGVGALSGGTVALVNGSFDWLDAQGDLDTGWSISIRRVNDLTQTTDLRNQGSFFGEDHEDALDKLTMIDQQQQDEIDRSIRLSETYDPSDISTILPAPSAGLVIGWNDDEDGLVNLASAGSVAVSAFGETLIDDANAAAGRTTLDAAQKVASCTAETAPAVGDYIGLVDASESDAENKMTLENMFKVINSFTEDATPLSSDFLLTYDASASGVKKAGPAAVVRAGITSPTQQRFTSGTAQTYTTPANVKYIRVRMVGGGGGGGGGGIDGGAGNGAAGGDTSFGTSLLTATGGAATGSTGKVAGAGGTGTINSPAYGTVVAGGIGGGATSKTTLAVGLAGGAGAPTPFGGAGGGGGNANGTAAAANSGSGGGGGSGGNSGSGTAFSGAGGSAGSFIDAIIPAPGASYSYTVGGGGAGGSAGTDGFSGGAGAAGYIEVTEYFQ